MVNLVKTLKLWFCFYFSFEMALQVLLSTKLFKHSYPGAPVKWHLTYSLETIVATTVKDNMDIRSSDNTRLLNSLASKCRASANRDKSLKQSEIFLKC